MVGIADGAGKPIPTNRGLRRTKRGRMALKPDWLAPAASPLAGRLAGRAVKGAEPREARATW